MAESTVVLTVAEMAVVKVESSAGHSAAYWASHWAGKSAAQKAAGMVAEKAAN